MNPYVGVVSFPHHVAFDITNRCNLRCLHCYNSSGENCVMKDEMGDGEVLDFVRSVAVKRPYSFCFCGGEPLLRASLVMGALEELRTGKVNVGLVTNGMLLDREIASDLEKCGLSGIQISLDGNKGSHNRLRGNKGAYDGAIRAIDNVLRHTDLHLQIAFSPTSFNICNVVEEIKLIEQLLHDSGRLERNWADRVELRVQPMMLLGRARCHSDIVPDADQHDSLVRKIRRLQKGSFGCSLSLIWGDPVDHLVRYADSKRLSTHVAVHANGDIVVSPYLNMVVGNVKRHSLAEYWASGLNSVWSLPFIRSQCSRILCIRDMDEVSKIDGDLNQGHGTMVDLIDKK